MSYIQSKQTVTIKSDDLANSLHIALWTWLDASVCMCVLLHKSGQQWTVRFFHYMLKLVSLGRGMHS